MGRLQQTVRDVDQKDRNQYVALNCIWASGIPLISAGIVMSYSANEFEIQKLLLFFLVVFVLTFGYMRQIYKIESTQSTEAVSVHAYIISLIAALSMMVFSDNALIACVSTIELLLCAATIYILKHRNAASERFDMKFAAGLAASVIMIHGIRQMITSLSNKGKESQVSVSAYLSYIALNLCIISITDDSLIILALLCNICVYMVICAATMLSKINNNSSPQ